MTTSALIFMVLAWGTILVSSIIFLSSLLKHSKQ